MRPVSAKSDRFPGKEVFVAPSREDNLPNIVIESMTCGTPVAAFDVGGMRDMIDHRHNGYLAKPFDTAFCSSHGDPDGKNSVCASPILGFIAR